MEFANLLMLFGAAALSIPLIIHLLNRSKFEVVPWAAMHLLQSVNLQNQKRLKWQSWLLLFIRCLIPLILALCMAGPLLTAWKTSGAGQSSLTIVLDNSYSLQGKSSHADQTKLQWGRQQVQQIIQSLGSGTRYSVVLAGSSATPLFEGSTLDHRLVYRNLALWTGDQQGLSTTDAIADAINTNEAASANHQVLIVSDFQSADWQQGIQSPANANQEVPISLLPISSQQQDNLQVKLEHQYSEVVGRSEPIEVRVSLRNWGNQEATEVPVDLLVDQQPIANRKISVAANSQSQVVFGCQIDQPGSHQIQVRIEDPSGWSTDNQTTLPVRVIDQLHVLLVQQSPDQDVPSSNFFWELALQASSIGNQSEQRWLQTRRTTVEQLKTEWIQQADVIVLDDVPKLNDSMKTEIAEQIADGTGLLILAGPQLDPQWYQQWQFESQTEDQTVTPISPVQFGPWQVADSVAENAVTFAAGPYAHPALSFFDSPSQSELTEVRLLALSPMTAIETATVAARTSNDLPLLVTHRVGKGQVAAFATSLNDQYTNLQLRPSFVPLANRLTLALAGEAEVAPIQGYQSTESNPDYLNQQQQQELATALNGQLAVDASQFVQQWQTKRNGKEIWRWVLAALVLFLFAELLLQRPFSEGV